MKLALIFTAGVLRANPSSFFSRRMKIFDVEVLCSVTYKFTKLSGSVLMMMLSDSSQILQNQVIYFFCFIFLYRYDTGFISVDVLCIDFILNSNGVQVKSNFVR